MTNDRASRLVAAGLLAGIVLLSIPLVAHGYAGTFTRFMGDDYCDASTFRREGLIGAQRYFYITWGAVPTTIVLMGLVHAGGVALARWLPAIALIVWIATCAWAFAQFTPLPGVRHRMLLALFLAESLVFATCEDAPTIIQSLYLRVPMLAYLCPVIALAGYIGFCRRTLDRPAVTRGRLAASAIFAFVAGSFGPVFVAMQTTAIAVALAAVRVAGAPRVRRHLSGVLAAGLAGSIVALVFIAAAPGNTRRATFFPPRPSVPHIVTSTVLTTAFMMTRPALPVLEPVVIAAVPRVLPEASRWLDRALLMQSSPLVFLFLLLLGGGIGMASPQAFGEGVDGRARTGWLIAIPLAAFAIVAGAIVVGPFGTSAPPPPRALIMPQFAIDVLTLAWGFVAGTMVRDRVHRRGASISRALVPVAAALLVLVAVQSARSTMRTMGQTPAMREWAATWDRGDEELRAAARTGRVAAFAPRLDAVGGIGSIGPDPTDWVNDCAAQYYGLASVTGR